MVKEGRGTVCELAKDVIQILKSLNSAGVKYIRCKDHILI